MQKIQQLLQPHNIIVSDEEIAVICTEAGVDIDNLTDSQASAIAQHILEERSSSAALTVQNKKNGNGKVGKKSPRRKPLPPLQGAIAHAAQVSNTEIQSLEDVLNQGIDAYTTDKADELLASVRNAPKEVVNKFVTKAMEEEADVDSFRGVGHEIVEGIFGISLANAAE